MRTLPEIQLDAVHDDEGEPRLQLSWVEPVGRADRSHDAFCMRKLMTLFQHALDNTVEGEEISTCIALAIMEREGVTAADAARS